MRKETKIKERLIVFESNEMWIEENFLLCFALAWFAFFFFSSIWKVRLLSFFFFIFLSFIVLLLLCFPWPVHSLTNFCSFQARKKKSETEKSKLQKMTQYLVNLWIKWAWVFSVTVKKKRRKKQKGCTEKEKDKKKTKKGSRKKRKETREKAKISKGKLTQKRKCE